MASSNGISLIVTRQPEKATNALPIAICKAKHLHRTTNPQHKVTIARNRDMASLCLDILEAKSGASDLVAAYLIVGVK